jgi:hypothetical protein
MNFLARRYFATQKGAEQHSLRRLRGEAGEGESESTAPLEKRKGRPTAAPQSVTPQESTIWRQFTSDPEDLVANVFENVGSAFDANFPGQDGIFVFDAENAVVADIHVSLDDGLPD